MTLLPTSQRRTLQQIKHCVEEALSAHEHNEDPRHVVADLEQAAALIEHVLKPYRLKAKDASI